MSSANQPSASRYRPRTVGLILVAASTLTLLLQTTGVLDTFERATLDLQHRAHLHPVGEDSIDPRIVIIAVDQRSIDYFDRNNVPFPWPRSLYNPIIEFASRHGARAILFDILFNNDTPFGPEVDQQFADAIAASGRVHLAASFSSQSGDPEPRPDDAPDHQTQVATAARRSTAPSTAAGVAPGMTPGVSSTGEPPSGLRREHASLPIAPLNSAAAGIAFVTQRPDPDGIYRHASTLLAWRDRAIPSLGLAPLLQPEDQVHWNEDGSVQAGDYRLPTDAEGQLLLRFRSADPFRRISALDVIHSAMREQDGEAALIDPALFDGTYVFIAYTALGLYDLKPTPVKEISPGIEVHATLLANLLDHDFLRAVPTWAQWLLALLATLAGILATIKIQSIGRSAMLLLALAGSLLAATQWAFHSGWVWNLPLLFTPVLTGFVLAAGYRYHVEGRQRRFLQSAFGHYVAPQVVDIITRSPEGLELGGQKRDITLLFSDLAGFTAISEDLAPQELVLVLNGYTSLMADTITEFEGTVDKFIGDAVMAFWGAPLDQPDQALQAVTAALECLRRFDQFAQQRFPDVPLGVRLGIDRGECIVGNMGSRKRFDYTAIGDTVNQAARLEGLNKAYGSRLLIGEQAWQGLETQLVGRQIDFLKVKGKSRATRVYEALATQQTASPEQIRLCEDYQHAFAAYQARHWSEAEQRLQQVLKYAADAPSQALLQRIAVFRQQPPPDDWDGAFVHTSK